MKFSVTSTFAKKKSNKIIYLWPRKLAKTDRRNERNFCVAISDNEVFQMTIFWTKAKNERNEVWGP